MLIHHLRKKRLLRLREGGLKRDGEGRGVLQVLSACVKHDESFLRLCLCLCLRLRMSLIHCHVVLAVVLRQPTNLLLRRLRRWLLLLLLNHQPLESALLGCRCEGRRAATLGQIG